MVKTILVIDDNDDIRENTAEILELEGYKAITADNGQDGVALAINHLPSVILCDIVMPDMDGLAVFKAIAANDNTRKIPFVVMTARAEKCEIQQAFDLGIAHYLVKPFDVELLIEKINLVTA